MASKAENMSEQLFKIIKGFGHDVILFTEDGKKTVDPAEARRFYAKDIQMMVNYVNDEATNEIVVNLSKGTDLDTVSDMLSSIRTLAGRYIVEYTVKTFGKAISPKDFAFMAKQTTNESESTRPLTRDELEQEILGRIQRAGSDRLDVHPSYMEWIFNRLEKQGKIYTDDGNTYTMANESEQLDELSPKTLARYGKKAADDLARTEFKSGASPYDREKIDKLDRRADKRQKGIGRAFDKLASEQTDNELDEKKAPKIRPDFVKTQRKKDAEHDSAMGRTNTGRKKPVRAMTSTQRSMASMREEQEPLEEGFSGWHGTARKSVNELGDARIIVRHKRSVDEEKRGARTRQIESVFIENCDGERFKFPNKNITAAKAMLKHVKEGGAPFDDFGQHIYSVMEELEQLKKFQRHNRRNDFFESESGINEEIGARVTDLRRTLSQISGPKGYSRHFESFSKSTGNEVAEEQINELKDAVTVQYFDERIAESLPYVAKVIEGFRSRQEKEKEIQDFGRYVLKHQNNIELNRPIDMDDPESPMNRKYRDKAAEISALVTYMAPFIKDDALSNMMMQVSDTVFEVGPKFQEIAMIVLRTIQQKAHVAETAQPTEKTDSFEAISQQIEESFNKYSVRKLFE